jgi:Cof subfamily protein (haloacid dehalogenase superfamily)
MGKFDGILICTDLDGTLYRNDKTISAENKEAIEYFKREGGYFTFITGRMPYYSLAAYNAVNPNVPFGCVNSGGVYDGVAQKYVWTCEMPEGYVELIERVDEQFSDVGIQVCLFDKTYFVKENDTMVSFRKVTGIPNLVCDYHCVKEPVAKVLFGSGREENILGIQKTLAEHPLASRFSFVRSSRTLFEIVPNGINKGVALQKLIEYLKLDPKKTVAIGDYNNDIGMFRAAGIGIAVSNACKDALEAADIVTVSNEEHAIARVIYDIESGKIGL